MTFLVKGCLLNENLICNLHFLRHEVFLGIFMHCGHVSGKLGSVRYMTALR